MSMEINNAYNSCAAAAYAKDSANTKESSVTTSTVELKTSTPGVTRTEQIKTGFRNVNDYSGYLQEKYNYMNTGTTSMQGIPVTVSVSGAFLKKCMNDPEKAKYLEENLRAIPDCVNSLINYTKTMPGSPVVTYSSYMIDENGNISVMSGCTNDPDGKIARENAKRKACEKKAAEEKAAKRRAEEESRSKKMTARKAEKRAARQEAAERIAEGKKAGEYTVTITGTHVKSIMQSMAAKIAGMPAASISDFDARA